MRVLGIESSCDETGVAVYESDRGLTANVLYSQIKLHQAYGGVVPELASRDHVRHIVSLVEEALMQAQIKKTDIDAIAYTSGPGLIGALLTGACFAKSLAYGLDIPALAVHHLEAHLLAAQLDNPKLEFPFIVLLVSGGHTQLILAKSLGEYQILGETLDDAVGEAFDKTAKLMGLPYPGGAALAQLADQNSFNNIPAFPRPLLDNTSSSSNYLNFSFSGLKTHALQVWNKTEPLEADKIKIAAAFQSAVVDTLVEKCRRAFTITGQNKLVIAGGVGANHALRKTLTTLMNDIGGKLYFPKIEFCTDNGAMIAYAGFLYLAKGEKDNHIGVEVKARWSLG